MENESIQNESVESYEYKPTELKSNFRFFPFFNRKQPVFILVVLGIVFYFTSLYNEYALDDGIIIHQNENVIKGVSGIPDILTSDVYASFYKRMCATDQLQGGRYRPLSVISFALEQEFIGSYRTGLYMRAEDCNHNGKLDEDKVTYRTPCGVEETNYEYNAAIDLDGDGAYETNECMSCWDLNNNFHNDWYEDLNQDGVFNEVDCQVYGAYLRHFNNIWTYVLACVLLYLVFRNYFFKNNHDLAFLAALIFLVHPVHSEVVANVRGRDDIFSVLFIAATFLLSFKYLENKKIITLISAANMFFMALLSKEYGLMMLVVLPLGVHVFSETKIEVPKFLLLFASFLMLAFAMLATETESTLAMIGSGPVIVGCLVIFTIIMLVFRRTVLSVGFMSLMACIFWVTLAYIGARIMAVKMDTNVPDTEILNNPFLFANGEEKFATKIYVLLKYFGLSVFPKTLVSDYSYGEIPYRHFTDWDFIVSLVLHINLIVLGVWLTVKRHIVGFAILTYLLFLLVAGNFIMGTGVLMLEANLFHATIGTAVGVAWVVMYLIEKVSSIRFNVKRTVLIVSSVIVIVICGCKTWERNRDWKNDITLFLKDVKNSPNSVLILGNAGARWVDLADTREITGVTIPGQDSTRFNDYNGTLQISDEEVKAGGYKTKREAALYKGIGYLKHAVELHPRYVNGYLNLGLAHYKLGKDFEAILYWKLAERLYPSNPYLRNYYIVYNNQLNNKGGEAFEKGDYKTAAIAYNKATIVDPNNAQNWYLLGGTYYSLQNFRKAKECWERSLQINPDYKEAKSVLQMINLSPTK